MADYPFFFTWTAQRDAQPMHITGGEGAWFTTSDGGRWLDLGSLIYQASLGHGHPRMIEAVKAQAGRLCLTMPSAVYPEKVALAEKLLSLAPKGFDRVLFTLGGSDANENAIKIAKLFTGRHKMLARYRSYHGATMGAASLSGDWRRPAVEPGLTGVVHALDFDCARCPGGTRAPDCAHEPLTTIPRVLELEGPGTVAAVFLESVVGGNGVLVPPPGYLARVREACDRHGTLLVMDEVLAGFGRTGKMFGFEHAEGLVPDMITCGKAITGGYGTLGAVLVHERVSSHFDTNVLVAGLTHYAHPLAVAAGLEALRVLEDEKLVARAAALEAPLRAGLAAIAAKVGDSAGQRRVIGLLGGIELGLDAHGWKKLKGALSRRRVHAHVVPKSGMLVLSPPLSISEGELSQGLALVGEAVSEALS